MANIGMKTEVGQDIIKLGSMLHIQVNTDCQAAHHLQLLPFIETT